MQTPIVSESLSFIDSELISATFKNDITEDRETMTTNGIKVDAEKSKTEKFFTTRDINTESSSKTNIELKEGHIKETAKNIFMKEKENTTTIFKGTSENSKSAISELKENSTNGIGSSATYFNDHTTQIPDDKPKGFETESLIVTRNSFTNFNRPLIKSTTSKPDFYTKRSFTPFNRLRTTTAKITEEETETNVNEETTEELNIESTTRRSPVLKNRPIGFNKFNRARTTTVRSIEEVNEISSLDETTEHSRLIRYGTTTPPTEEEEDEQQKIETSTRRNFRIKKLNALTTRRSFDAVNRTEMPAGDSATENETKNDEKISSEKPAQTRYFGGFSRNRTSGSFFGFNRHITTTASIADKVISTTEEDSDKPNFSTTEPYEGITRSTQADELSDETDSTVTIDEESLVHEESSTQKNNLLTSTPFHRFSTLLTSEEMSSSDEGSGENLTTEEILTENTMSTTRPYEFTTDAAVTKTDSMVESDETTTQKPALSTNEPFSGISIEKADGKINDNEQSPNTTEYKESLSNRRQLSTFTRPTTTQASAVDLIANGIEYNLDKGSTEKLDSNIETTEENTEHKKVFAKGALPTRSSFGSLNRQRTSSESVILENDATMEENEKSFVNKEASTKESLSIRSPLGDLPRTTTTETATVKGTDLSDGILEKAGTTKRIFPTRKPFGSYQPTTTTSFMDIEKQTEISVDNEENITANGEVTTKRTFGTRSPYASFNRPATIQTTVKADERLLENNEDYVKEMEIATERSLHTRRPFGSFTRPAANIIQTTIKTDEYLIENDDDSGEKVENVTERSLHTRRVLGSFTRPTPSSQRIRGTIKSDNEKDSGKYNLPSRRPYVSFTRYTTSTTEAATDETDSTLEIKTESTKYFEISNKTTRKPFAGFKRPSTAENYIEDIFSESRNDEESSTKQNFSNGKTFRASSIPSTTQSSYDDSTYATSSETEDVFTSEETLKDEEATKTDKDHNKETLKDNSRSEEASETTSPETTDSISDPRRKVAIRKLIRIPTTVMPITNDTEESEDEINEATENEFSLSTTTTNAKEETTQIFYQESENENSTDINSAQNDKKTTKLHLITSGIPSIFTGLSSISTTTEEGDDFNESTTLRQFLLSSNRTKDLIDGTTKKSVTDYSSATDDEEQTTSTDTQTDSNARISFSRLNRFQTSTESATKFEKEESGSNISNDVTTQRTYARLYKFQTTTKSPLEDTTEEQDTEHDSTFRISQNNYNRYKTITKSSRLLESNNKNDHVDSEDNIEVSTHPSLGTFSQLKRLNLNSQTERTTQISRLNNNRNLYNRNSQQNEEDEEEVEEFTHPSFISHRQQSINSNSQSLTDRKGTLKPFNFNRPQFQRKLPRPIQAEEEEAYEEDDDEEDNSKIYDFDEEYPEKETILASQELASKEPSSSLLTLRNRVRIEKTQGDDSEHGLENNRNRNLLNTRARTQTTYNTTTTKSSEITTENIDKEVAITKTSNTNTNRFGTNRYNSTVANYLNRTKTKLSQTNTNTAPSHKNQDNVDILKIDIVDKVDEEDDDVESEVSNSNKYNVNQYNNVYKGDDNDSKRRFQKYQFQRRTTTSRTTTTTRTTTAPSVEAEGDNEATKNQVNLNDAYESERQTSTNIPETTAPITTESLSLPATPLQRRIKILKLKRPLVSNINNTNSNITFNAIASSATNLNVSHTETQNIVKLSSSEVDSQVDKTETLTETKTQMPIPPQTSPSTTPKHIRKVIRKLIRPVNRITENTSATEDEKSNLTTSRRQNATRFGFNRSTKFKTSADEGSKDSERAENGDELTEKIKTADLANRGRNRFALPSGVSSTTENTLIGSSNRNRFSSRQQPSSTTEESKPIDDSDEDEEDVNNEDHEEDDEEEQEEVEITTVSYSASIRSKLARPPLVTTENGLDTDISTERETTTESSLISKNSFATATTEQIAEQQQVVLNHRIKFGKTSHEEKTADDPLLKLRTKVKQELAKGNQEEEGVLSTRFKSTKIGDQEVELQIDDPLLKLRNKVKQDLAKTHQVEGVLNDRLKSSKNESEFEGKEDPLLKLRNKVKQELAKSNQEEGVVSVKLKKLLETKNSTSIPNYKVEDIENESISTKESLSLQKIRDKVQTNLAKKDQDEGVVSSRLKKLLSEKNNSTALRSNVVEEDNESETSTELKEASGDGDLLETSKPFTPRKPFVPKSKLPAVDNENQIKVPSTFAPKERPTFRRKLVAKRPYIPTKSPLSVLATTTIRTPTTKSKNKYVRGKFGGLHAFNANNHNNGEGFTQTNLRGNKLPRTNLFKIEGSAGGKNAEDEDYQEYDEEEEDEEVEEEKVSPKAIQPVKLNIAKPPSFFDRPQSVILKNSIANTKEQVSDDNEDENEEEEENEDDEEDGGDDDEDDEEDENENESPPEFHKTIINSPIYKPKDNRIPPGARPALTTIPTIKKPLTPSRKANRPYRPGSISATTTRNGENRVGSSSKSTVKTRVINRPQGFSVPNLTIKPVANDFERTTVLIPTKPAPFINPNTRAYERKYTGPTTESSVDSNSDSNPLIEDLNIEALNARNKKIFDINSKKHTTLKPKVIIPLAKQNENTQEQQQETNTEFENDENDYQSSVGGFATTTSPIITSNTNTQQQQEQQEHIQSTTLDTTTIGTQNTDDANQSNANNLNEIFSQDGFTTTPTPSTTLLHIFTLSDGEQTTQNPFNDGNQVVPRLIIESVKPKHKVVEINRIVEVNSKEEKLRRKSKANTIVAVEGSQTYKVESLPHVEQLGEISVVKYVHQVDGSDITIEGRSTVTDYTPTEPTVSGSAQPLHYSLPEKSSEQRYGKALIPEVRETETSTISLEGLFESARKGKILNTIDDVDNANNGEIKPVTESPANGQVETATEASKIAQFSTESFNIFKSIAFDVAKINWEPNSKEIDINKKSLESISTTTSTTAYPSTTIASEPDKSLITTLAPEILTKESTTVDPEDAKATTVAAALFPQYLRTPATVSNYGLTVTRRPVLSVRRRLINTSTAAAAANTQQTTVPTLTTLLDSSSTVNDEYITTSKFKRLRTNRPPTFNTAAVDITTDTTAATSYKTNNKLKKKSAETLSNDLKLASSSLTSSSSADNDITSKQTSKAQTSAALRRKFQARRLTTSAASNTNSDGTATEPPRTQNPLFKRRFSLTTYSPLSVKSGQPSKTATGTTSTSSSTLPASIDSLTTTVYVDGLENEEATDQVAKSSIHTSRFNQINGRLHIDDDDDVELDAGISNVENGGLKSLTTISSATRQPASRFLQQQSPPQLNSNFNYDDVITRRMDGTGIVAKSSTGTTTTTGVSTSATVTQAPAIKKRKMIIKRKPQKTTPSSEVPLAAKRRRPHKYQEPFARINNSQSKTVVKTSTQPGRTYRPNLDYDYYDDEDVRLVGNRSDQQLKVILHGGGIIECLDQGNFPHPLSCRKFISCAKFETGGVVGWEYTCPKGLSYDPVGGMCNWAAGLGCKE